MQIRLALGALLLVACGSGNTTNGIKIVSITPDHAPLGGGGRVVITGQGFLADGAPPDHVLFGGFEAPLASATDDLTLEVETPVATMAGDVPVTILNRNGQATAMGLFHFSAPPAVASLSPVDVPFDSVTTTVTATGSGFSDDDAGLVSVTVGGATATDVKVVSDTQITFTAPPGIALARPDVTITDARGSVTLPAALRYVPSSNPALMAFAKNSVGTYLVFFDPTTGAHAEVPSKQATQTLGFRAAVQDASGALWALQRDNKFGKVDLEKQVLVNPKPLPPGTPRINSLANVGGTIYAVTNNGLFGAFDLGTGVFSQIASGFSGCGNALATDGTTLYYATWTSCGSGTPSISQVVPATGAISNTVAFDQPLNIEEMRFLGTKLYGTSSGNRFPGNIVSIDPATGVTSIVQTFDVPFSAIEIFAPGAPSTVTP